MLGAETLKAIIATELVWYNDTEAAGAVLAVVQTGGRGQKM